MRKNLGKMETLRTQTLTLWNYMMRRMNMNQKPNTILKNRKRKAKVWLFQCVCKNDDLTWRWRMYICISLTFICETKMILPALWSNDPMSSCSHFPEYIRFKRIKECGDTLCPEPIIGCTDVLAHVAPLNPGDYQAPVIYPVPVPGAREQLPATTPPPFNVWLLSRYLNQTILDEFEYL